MKKQKLDLENAFANVEAGPKCIGCLTCLFLPGMEVFAAFEFWGLIE
jgi:hypothetical protein